MKTIFEVIKEQYIVISPPNFNNRLAVEIFPYKGGAVFFDVGWTMGFGHPLHILQGPISGDEEFWEFGDYKKDGDWTAHVYDPVNDSELRQNHDTWIEYLKTDEGKKYANRERALQVFKEGFDIK